MLNADKSRLSPFKSGVWLGWLLDLKEGALSVPDYRVRKMSWAVKNLLQAAKERRPVKVKALASVVSQVISIIW